MQIQYRNVLINTDSELYDKLLNICTTQYDNLSEDQKENLTLHFVEDDLLLMVAPEDDEEVKLEPEEKINKRVKLNLWKRKKNSYRIKNLDTKQIVNKTSDIISTNWCWKQFIQIEKWNKTNIASTLSSQ